MIIHIKFDASTDQLLMLSNNNETGINKCVLTFENVQTTTAIIHFRDRESGVLPVIDGVVSWDITDFLYSVSGEFQVRLNDRQMYVFSITEELTQIDNFMLLKKDDKYIFEKANGELRIGVAIKYIEQTYAKLKDLDADVGKFKTVTTESISAVAGEIEHITGDLAEYKVIVAGDISAANGRIDTISGDLADYKKVVAGSIEAITGNFEDLKTNALTAEKADLLYASIGAFDAISGRVGTLEGDFLSFKVGEFGSLTANVADIKTLIFGSATGNIISSDFSNSVVAQIGTAQIKSAMIDTLAFNKLTGIDINTTNLRVHSEDGKSQWFDNTIQISDKARVRVQIGKDAAGDYSMYVWDASGKLMFDALGLTDSGIQREIIRNDMVAANANISGEKLNIVSVFKEMNGSTETLKSNRIYLDEKKQTLNVAFLAMSDKVTDQGSTLSSYGTQLTTVQGQISSKIWKQDISTAVDAAQTAMSSQYSNLEQNLTGFKTTVASTYSTKTALDSEIDKLTDRTATGLIEVIEGTGFLQSTKTEDEGCVELEISGKSEQVQTSGKNLCPSTGTSGTISGVTYKVNEDGSITFNGTSTYSPVIWFKTEEMRLPAGTYTVSGITGGATDTYCLRLGKGESNEWFTELYDKQKTFTLSEAMPITLTLAIKPGVAFPYITVYPQIESGTAATTYEPYTGAKPAPSPDYPQEIKSVGNPVVTVCGKNLFNVEYLREQQPISSSGGYKKYALNVIAGKTYTFSISKNESLGKGVYVLLTDDLQYSGGAITQGKIYAWMCHETNNSLIATKKTVIVGDEGKLYLAVAGSHSEIDMVISMLPNAQLEAGSEATPYEPYAGHTAALTDVTLRSLPDGTADRLEKRGGVWGIERQIKEQVLDGTETWLNYANSNGAYVYQLKFTDTKFGGYTSICSNFRNVYNAWNLREIGTYSDHLTIANKYFVSDKTTKEEWEAWLAEQYAAGIPVTINYTLATPTWEPLPADLQIKLNNLETYSPVTNVFVTSNLIPDITGRFYTRAYAYSQQTSYKIAEIDTTVDGITSRVEKTEVDSEKLEKRLSTAEQKITADAIISTVSKSNTFATKDEFATVDGKFKNYPTTVQMNSAIEQKANDITASVSGTYTTKTELGAKVSELNAALSLKIDEKNLISKINASADVISLDAGRLLINSGNFKLDSTGKMTAVNGEFTGKVTATSGIVGGWQIGESTLKAISADGRLGTGFQKQGVGTWSVAVGYDNTVEATKGWSTAAFRVSHTGAAYASNMNITGGEISIKGNNGTSYEDGKSYGIIKMYNGQLLVQYDARPDGYKMYNCVELMQNGIRLYRDDNNFMSFGFNNVPRFGTVAIVPSAANTPTAKAIKFNLPFRNGMSPIVIATPITTVPGTQVKGVGVTGASSTGCNIYLSRSNTGSTTIYWLAIAGEIAG